MRVRFSQHIVPYVGGSETLHLDLLALSFVGRAGVEGVEDVRMVVVRKLVQIVRCELACFVLDGHSRASVAFALLAVDLIHHDLVRFYCLRHERVILDDGVQVDRRAAIRLHRFYHDARVHEAFGGGFNETSLRRGRQLPLNVRALRGQSQTADVAVSVRVTLVDGAGLTLAGLAPEELPRVNYFIFISS